MAPRSIGPHRIAPEPRKTSRRYRSGPVDTYWIYDGTDENGIVGPVAPGLFAQEGWCWRVLYENPVGHAGHCMKPAERVRRGRGYP